MRIKCRIEIFFSLAFHRFRISRKIQNINVMSCRLLCEENLRLWEENERLLGEQEETTLFQLELRRLRSVL